MYYLYYQTEINNPVGLNINNLVQTKCSTGYGVHLKSFRLVRGLFTIKLFFAYGSLLLR